MGHFSGPAKTSSVILEQIEGFVPDLSRDHKTGSKRAINHPAYDMATKYITFCLGSFRDAAWLRRNNLKPAEPRLIRLESPARCLLFLATVAALSMFFALRVPDITITPEMAKSLPRPPGYMFAMIITMASMILPAITSLSLGEYPAGKYPLRRWMFLTAKIVLILPVVYFLCRCIYYQNVSHQALQIPVHALLVACILTFRWILDDQRQRCPMCLRLLGHSANVGQPARNFLEWNGTELMCTRGHGLLHVPATPASWSGTQRWFYLDPSWRSLFS